MDEIAEAINSLTNELRKTNDLLDQGFGAVVKELSEISTEIANSSDVEE